MPKSKTAKSSFAGLSVKERKQAGIPLDAILNPRLKREDAICRGINYGCECVACILLLFLKKGGKVKWADIKRYNDPIKGGFKFIDTELPKWIGAGRVAQDQREQYSVAIQEQKAHETQKLHNSEIIKDRRFEKGYKGMQDHLFKDTLRTIHHLTDKLKLPQKERDAAMGKVRDYVIAEQDKLESDFRESGSRCPVEWANRLLGLNEALRNGEFSITAMKRKDHAQWKKENPNLDSLGDIPLRKSALEKAEKKGMDVKYYTTASPPPVAKMMLGLNELVENGKVGDYIETPTHRIRKTGQVKVSDLTCPVCDTDSDSDSDSEYFTAESESDSDN